MRGDWAMFGLHGAGAVLALTAALLWPRAGQAALMVPVASGDIRTVIGWAALENAPLLALDTANGRIIARVTDNRSLLRALEQGILPLAARSPGCQPQARKVAP